MGKIDEGRDWVCLSTFASLPEAELAKQALQNSGIEAQVANEASNRIMSHLASIIPLEVKVRQSDLVEAQAILKSFETPLAPNESAAETDGERSLRFAFNTALFGFFCVPGISGLIALYHLSQYFKTRSPDSRVSIIKVSLTLFFSVTGILLAAYLISVVTRYG